MADTTTTPAKTAEPVLIAHAVTVLLGALVGLGWLTLPDSLINTVGTVVFVLVSTVGAVMARGKVTPVDGSNRPVNAEDVVAYVTGVVRDEIEAFEQRQAHQANTIAQQLAARNRG